MQIQSTLEPQYHVLSIERGTTVDGPGFRTSVYLAGCTHKCLGCHNPQSHDPAGGVIMPLSEIMEIICEEDFDVTLTGGDPLCHSSDILPLVKAIKLSGYGIWLYTGYTWEQILSSPALLSIVNQVDVVVDSPFQLDKKDPDLLFRGSSNQRIIMVRESLATGELRHYVE